jgi:hypothetical protein
MADGAAPYAAHCGDSVLGPLGARVQPHIIYAAALDHRRAQTVGAVLQLEAAHAGTVGARDGVV